MKGYLVFVLGCMGIEVISIAACINKIKREGYKFNFKKKSFLENVCECIEFFLENLIPVYNILLVTAVLMSATNEKAWDTFLEKCIEKGVVTKSEEQLAKEEADRLAQLEDNEIRKSLDTKEEDTQNKYSMMSNDEKLAFLKKERDSILNSQTEDTKVYQKRNTDGIDYHD